MAWVNGWATILNPWVLTGSIRHSTNSGGIKRLWNNICMAKHNHSLNLEETITLFDLINTSLEGGAKAQRGRSKVTTPYLRPVGKGDAYRSPWGCAGTGWQWISRAAVSYSPAMSVNRTSAGSRSKAIAIWSQAASVHRQRDARAKSPCSTNRHRRGGGSALLSLSNPQAERI